MVNLQTFFPRKRKARLKRKCANWLLTIVSTGTAVLSSSLPCSKSGAVLIWISSSAWARLVGPCEQGCACIQAYAAVQQSIGSWNGRRMPFTALLRESWMMCSLKKSRCLLAAKLSKLFIRQPMHLPTSCRSCKRDHTTWPLQSSWNSSISSRTFTWIRRRNLARSSNDSQRDSKFFRWQKSTLTNCLRKIKARMKVYKARILKRKTLRIRWQSYLRMMNFTKSCRQSY